NDLLELLDARTAREHAGLEHVEHGVNFGLRDVGLTERDMNGHKWPVARATRPCFENHFQEMTISRAGRPCHGAKLYSNPFTPGTRRFMSQPPPDQPRKSRKNTEFWRACHYLGPYRRIVIVSIVCAFFVGGITAAGLGAMLPILQVLLNNETLQGYVD